MVKYFLLTVVILYAFFDASSLSTDALSQDVSTTKSGDEKENVTDSLLDEDVSEQNSSCYFNVTKNGKLKLNGALKESENCVWNITANKTITAFGGLLFEEVILDDSDILTIHRQDENETLILGPFNGTIPPLVAALDEKNFTVKLNTSDKKLLRVFQLTYNSQCIFAIPPDIATIESPIYPHKEKKINCRYDYNKIHSEVSYSFVFKNFSLDSDSQLEITDTGTSQDGTYKTTPPDIFGKQAMFNITLNANSSSNKFTIVRRDLYDGCSGFIQVSPLLVPVLQSPPPVKPYNGSAHLECRWLIKTVSSDSTLRLIVDKLQFNSVLDTLTVNDGPSELSVPIVQAARISQNETKAQMIKTSGSYMWISFRSEDFASVFVGNYSEGKGGYYHGSKKIAMQSDGDSVFLLEVASNETVLLNFDSSGFANPTSINVYDAFNTMSSPIARLNGSIWYPVVSSTSKMMVEAKSGTKFTAEFKGITSDCVHMSASSNDAYVLSGNCNSSCAWIVPPNNASGEVLLLGIQFISLDVNDVVEVFQLGNSQKSIANISYGVKRVPPMSFSSREGFYMNISRGVCSKKDDVALIAHATYLPGCSKNLTLNPSIELQLSSPNYPNLYPLFATCQWNLTASGSTTQFHLAFNKMYLAPNHCIQITSNGTSVKTFSGDQLPDDMLVGNVVINFDSFNCNKSATDISLVSDEGFVLNVTSSDCGSFLKEKSGNFNTSLTSKGNSTCFWIVQVPKAEADGSVNSIMFTIEEKAKGNNSEFHVHDGPSARDPLMTNLTQNVWLWSRTNTMIFVYKKFNTPGSSSVYTISYKTISCNKTMQCGNGLCLHPDWLCDGKNDCGDFTDERNCETVPVPHPVKESNGVSPVAFGIVTVLFFGLGALAAFLIPKAINRYRTGRYHQFQDYAGVD